MSLEKVDDVPRLAERTEAPAECASLWRKAAEQ